jgi:hypothetical protein
MSEIADLDKRAKKAYDDGRLWRQLWDDLYTYAIPSRRPAQFAPKTDGANTDRVFDATATRAAFRFVGRVQRDAVPPYQEFVALEMGPAAQAVLSQVENKDAAQDMIKGVAEELGKWSAIGHSTLEASNFALASGETFIDYFGGQACFLMLESEEHIVEFVAVPAVEVGLRENGRGKVCGIYWRRKYRAADLPDEWDKPTFSVEMQRVIRETPEAQIWVVQSTEYNVKTKKWDFIVYFPDRTDYDPAIFKDELVINPWLTPRFYKVPGEAYGRGPGLMALPTIKTLNKVEELTLRAAAFAVLGLWAHRNDRVFNPRMARMAPGAMWAVQSTAGPLGPSIQKLDVPGRYDVSNMVLQDLREALKQTTFDDTLPPDSGAVRSATEIVERMKRLMNDLASVYPRLMREFIVPLWQWLLYVLYKRKLIKTQLPLDQLIMKLKITSPIARAQQASDVSNIVDWLQIILSTGGPQAMMLTAKVEDIYAFIGDKLGVPPQLIRASGERKQILSMVAQIVAAAQMQGQGGAPPPAGGEGQIPGASPEGAPAGVIPMSQAA